MTFRRDWACWLLLTLGIACIGAGVFPQWHEWTDPENGDRVSERRHGLWSSPSYQHVRRDHVARGGGFDMESGLHWLSWSFLLIVVGVACLEMMRWRLERGEGGQGQAKDIQATP
jgi:hypothetical protein